MKPNPQSTHLIATYTQRILDAKTLQELIAAYDDGLRAGFTLRELNRDYSRTYDALKTAAKAEADALTP